MEGGTMEQSEAISSLERRIRHLEQRANSLRIVIVGCVAVLLILGYGASRLRPASAADSKVLKLRGLIIEDSQGRPRILIGAPDPRVAGRTRQTNDNGIILVGENGADRVAIGVPTPAPQQQGKIEERISPGAGVVVDDLNGNERAGIGVLDNGRAATCIDYPNPIDREAICLGVLPSSLAGLFINAPNGDTGERAMMAVLNDGTSLMKLADTTGSERVMLLVQGDSPAKFLLLDPKAKTKVDLVEKIKP